jgi:signal transduction histidine kinase
VTTISPVPLEQALINLLGNALSFIRDDKSSQIKVCVKINPLDPETPIHIDVSDNGPGMSANQIRRLFEPRSSTKGKSGTGLGLYVSRNLLQVAGGALELRETARWGGTTFRIRLPVTFGPMDDALKIGRGDDESSDS